MIIIADGKAGRGKGTDANFVAENKIITEVTKNKKWVGGLLPDARRVLKELLLDPTTPSTIRKGIAEGIINKGDQYYKEQNGIAKRSEEPKKKKKNIFSLEYKKTGTEER